MLRFALIAALAFAGCASSSRRTGPPKPTKVAVGMTQYEVRQIWGDPCGKKRIADPAGEQDRWMWCAGATKLDLCHEGQTCIGRKLATFSNYRVVSLEE